jgi:hypothetical protein
MPVPVQLTVGAVAAVSQADPAPASTALGEEFDAGVRGYPHGARFADGTLYAQFYVSPWLGRETRPANCISTDAGRSWSAARNMPVGPASEPLVLADDRLLYFNELQVEDAHVITATRCETRDQGASFREYRADTVFQLPDAVSLDLHSPASYWGQCGHFVYQYGFLREDSTIWTLVGAHCVGAKWCRLMLFCSTDQARTFDYISTVAGASDPAHGGFSEPTICRMADGSMLVVARTEYPPDDWRYLDSFRSTDDGRTWDPEGVPAGVPPVYRIRSQRPLRNSGKTHASAGNVSPALALLDNGIAVMAFGRPGQKVAFSVDGGGHLWTDTLRIVPEESLFGRNDRTSGMSGVVPTGTDRFTIIYDVTGYESSEGEPGRDTIFALEVAAQRP